MGRPCIGNVEPPPNRKSSVMSSVSDDIAFLAIAILAAETIVEDEPVRKKRKSPTIWERPWLAHRSDPTCENVYTLMLRLREVSTLYYMLQEVTLTHVLLIKQAFMRKYKFKLY